MTLYLDTEFNGFGGALISLALVSDRGGEFYAVRHLPAKIDPWVAEHVVPYLAAVEKEDHVIRAHLKRFLDAHDGEPVVADWPEDFVHLMQLMCEPGGISFNIELDMSLINSGDVKSAIPHNALSDARALMEWHKIR